VSPLFIPTAAVVAAAVALATPIPSSQDPSAGPAYLGHPVLAQPIAPKTQYLPDVSLMHGDGGGTNSTDYPGPLGTNPQVTSTTTRLTPTLWDPAGHLTTGCAIIPSDPSANGSCLRAVDPKTDQVLATWTPPETGQDLDMGYLEQTSDDRIVVASTQGHMYVVQRTDNASGTSFTLQRDIDLVADGTLPAGDPLLNSMLDVNGNIWFTTGAVLDSGSGGHTDTTLGYIEPDGKVVSMTIPNQVVENGIAVSGSTAYVVTGPAGADDHANATGYMSAFQAGPGDTITTAWQETYQAGSARKPGGFARGSGTTPALLGNRYVTIADHEDEQEHLLVYRQGTDVGDSSRLVCSVPLFTPGASAAEIGPIGHEQGAEDDVVVLNAYNYPPLDLNPTDINGSYNDMSQMTPGAERITVNPGGKGCEVRWNTPIRMKSVPTLSTSTGLIYGYTQDANLAKEGIYVWYLVALDFQTGNEVWRVRAGAGGTYNDSYLAASLGPDGTLYEGVQDGTVMLKDGPGPAGS